jgi:hypothetical protein
MHEGNGTFYYADGGRYEGQYKGGKFDGNGTLTWSNGNQYSG